MADYKVCDNHLLTHNKERVYAVVLAETVKKGFITVSEIHKYFDLTNSQLIEIRDALIADGKIEAIP